MSDARSKFMIAMAEGKVTWLKVEELGAKMMIQFRTPANHCSPRGAVDRIYTCKDFEAAWEQLEELYAQKPPAEEPQSDEVPTITLPYQPQKPLTIGTVNTWEYAIGTNALTIRCACGAELPIEKTMNEDGNLIVKVRPHNCAAYSHAATRRVCDRLAVLLNEHFDAIGD